MVDCRNIAIALLPLLGLTTLAPQTLAQSITPAADGTGTMIQQEGNTYTITGGTQVDSKVFHSFGELGLSPNEIANFLSNPTIQTIFGRVTGGNPSIIQGLLQVTGGNSNLLLMNPAGIVFTQGASFNIPGSLTVTTADAIGFESGFFPATGNVNYQNLVGAPNTFVFTGNNGSIVNAAELDFNQGNLALIGSSVINTGTLSTANGTITVTAVPENRTVRINQAGMVLGLEISPADLESGIQATDLARLLTGSNLQDDTGISVDANDELRLTDTNHPLDTAGNVTIAGQVEGNQVHLAAANQVNPIGNPETLIRTNNGEYSAPTVTRFAANPTDANSYIFLDATVPDYSNLLFGGEAGTTTVVVTPNENGIETITQTLTTPGLSLVDALHIVSEGSEGNFWLGNAFVDSNTIGQYQPQIATWNQGLNVGADILLYACFVALGSSGDALLNTLARYTGVDVAGSTNLTGFGGDWQLERSVGEIEATAPFEGNVLANYGDTLQVFTTTNGNDAGIGSLRQALLDANAVDGDDQIRFIPGLTEVTLTSDELSIDTRNGDLIIDGNSGGASNVIVERRAVTDIRIPRPYLPAAQQLYQWLVAPIEAELNTHQIDTISLLVDSGLRSLPMAVLHDGEQFLLEKYNVNLMPSISLTDTRYVDVKNLAVLAMGASEFTDQNPLPAVPVELATITEKLWQGQSFLNSTFTLQQLKAARNQTPFGILHLATHGEFKSGKPENSYIQFWQTKLALDQIRELGLNNPPVELMVLSACRTALGDEEAELGFTGLAVQAGVKSALGSLWYVSDEATLGLMTTFYSQLKQVPIKAEALRQTQLAMIRGEVRLEKGQLITPNRTIPLPPQLAELPDKELTHPYYWSAFTLVGSPW